MMDNATQERLDTMTAGELRALIKEALYSEDHLLKAFVKIMLIVDPGAVEDMYAWIKARFR